MAAAADVDPTPTADAPPAGRPALATAAWVGVVLIALAGASLALRSGADLANAPLVEDAYYAFSVSDHLADGDGPTIDGEALTNGFQPLFTFVSSPLFLAGDTTALRLLLLVQVAVLVITGVLLGKVVADATVEADTPAHHLVVPIVALLYTSGTFLVRTHLNGLETGTLLLLYVIWWRVYQRIGADTMRTAVLCGLAGGLTMLARIDAVFAVAMFALAVLILSNDRRDGLRRAVAFGLTAVAVASPWLLYNMAAFGSPVPTSGTAQQHFALAPSRLDDAVGAISQAVTPWTPFGASQAALRPLALPVVVLALAIWLFWMRRRPPTVDLGPAPTSTTALRSDTFAVVLTVAGGALALWYVLSSWAVHFYGRYLTFLVLPALYLWARFMVGMWRRAPKLAGAAVVALALLGVGSALVFWTDLTGSNTNLTQQVVLVERTVPDGEVVAAGQSGTLGFFREHVLNLDGKVNADAFEQRDDIAAYLDEEEVEWLCDWPSYVESYIGDPEAAGWEMVDEEGDFACYHRTIA